MFKIQKSLNSLQMGARIIGKGWSIEEWGKGAQLIII